LNIKLDTSHSPASTQSIFLPAFYLILLPFKKRSLLFRNLSSKMAVLKCARRDAVICNKITWFNCSGSLTEEAGTLRRIDLAWFIENK